MAGLGERTVKRDTYRHGDLQRALVEAGVELARAGGPDAVVVREATRRVGVAPNAAYRHFADRHALLEAVCAVAQTELALAMEKALGTVPEGDSPRAIAVARLRAVGVAYLGFAREQPGLFRTAFSVPGDMRLAGNPILAGNTGHTAFQLLGSALDELAEAGGLSPERRIGAELVAWSAVHGLATLLIDGPLRDLDAASASKVGERLFDMVEFGL